MLHTGQPSEAPSIQGHSAQTLEQPHELANSNTPSLSQGGFIMGRTVPGKGMPQQLPVFLLPFNGALATVPANGQCAYAALYASTTTTVETKLTSTSDVVRGSNVVKRSVYTLMMSNLVNDVACKALDPSKELQRLYPSHPAPPNPAVVTTALYRHYTQERARSVNAHIPAAF
ncbi:hypothetical protein PF008_g11611 [Phytophthora fragariae]|uniref:Uncharacterized protein n=1 Tax=Phytophthora fragariae TaxID=53985 RepID=A0A6G0RQT9_9STRA|nr:hypothetical protein PF008_g11611 [Phytophthora fragariae]